MKYKRLLSLTMAAALLLGSAAALPEGVFTSQTEINASAEQDEKQWRFDVGTDTYRLSYSVENNEVVITDVFLTGHNGYYIYVPDKIDGLPVTKISKSAFYNEYILAIRLPESLKIIDDYAFEYCEYLETVVLPGGLKSIGQKAFYSCPSLKTIAVPDSIESIGDLAFGYYYNYKENNLKTKIPDFSFCVNECPAVKDYAKNNDIKLYKYDTRELFIEGKCGDNVTYKLYPDHTIELSGTGSTNDYERYQAGNQLEEMPNPLNVCFDKVIINEGITRIGRAFFQNGFIKELILPDSITSLGLLVLYNANRIKTLKIGKGLKTLEDSYVLFSYTQFENISVNKDNKYFSAYNNSLYNKEKTKLIKYCCGRDQQFEIPSTVNTIGNDAVSSNSYLKSVKIPVSVKHIEIYAFDDCPNLKNITIPESVTDIHFRSMGNYTDKTTHKVVKNEELTIHCYKGSEAENFAKSANIKYKIIKCSHKFNVVSSKSATCTEDGERISVCEKCGQEKTEVLKKGHNYKTTVVKPTCTAKGYTLHKCSRCGDTYKDTYTDATGHSWSDWTTTKKATCTTAGTKVRTCSVCGKKETGTIAKTNNHEWSAWKTTGYSFTKNTSSQTRKCSVCGKTEKQTTKNAVSRLAGDNRYSTATKLSSTMYKTANTVVLATGLTYQDALVAVPLASAYNAPLLLGTERHITAQTEAELKRLKAKNVIVVSTNGAIGAKAKAELKGYKVTSIAGKNYFETAAKVAKALQAKTKKAPDTIFFATDSAFADALSASPVAAIKNAPIIYLKNKGSIDSATAAYLKSVKGNVKNAYVIGGDGVISDAMMKNVATALGLKSGKTVVRVAGKNRYETCVAVNNKFKSVLTSTGICVAKGLDFPDALAGGVYAAKNKQALFLADGKKLQDVQNTYLKSKNASKITVFGGTGAVSDELVKLIAKASV